MKPQRQAILAANWKMHGSRNFVKDFLTTLKNELPISSQFQCIIFPPFVFLDQVEKLLTGTDITWGGQNAATEEEGAFTGEVACKMLAEFGCQYVLIGHSERRLYYGENSEIIAKKFAQALKAGIKPMLCLGETLEQRNSGLTEQVINQQLWQVLDSLGGVSVLKQAILAYEPVWAIGTGQVATPEQAQEVHQLLRQSIANKDANIAESLCILYGGSVKASNAQALAVMPDIDGFLVGGASLVATEFLKIADSLVEDKIQNE